MLLPSFTCRDSTRSQWTSRWFGQLPPTLPPFPREIISSIAAVYSDGRRPERAWLRTARFPSAKLASSQTGTSNWPSNRQARVGDIYSLAPTVALHERVGLRPRPMTSSNELSSFISSSFRSVWALELLLLLKRETTARSSEELVAQMRASSSVVEKSLQELVAAGLAGLDGSTARYMPVSPAVAALVDETEDLYALRPDRVRRLIVGVSNRGLAAFSDAFRLKD